MKRFILKFVGSLMLLTGFAFAQQSLYVSQAPADYNNYSGTTVTLCSLNQAISSCLASPQSATSDRAGASAITFPIVVPQQQNFSFFAAPGLYTLLFQNATFGSPGNYTVNIQLPGDNTWASGTIAIPNTAVANGTCSTLTTAVTGITTTMAMTGSFPAAPTATAGNISALTFTPFVTAGNANVQVCNPSAASATPTAISYNFRVSK